LKVIIDTNAFMASHQFGIDIFDELQKLGFTEFVTLQQIIDELKRLAKTAKGKDMIAAKVGMKLAERCSIISCPSNADDAIVNEAQKLKAAVLTNDIELKGRLRNHGIKVVYMRQKNRLELSG